MKYGNPASLETYPVAWQRIAKEELGYLLCYIPEVTFDVASNFYSFLKDLLPANFDWQKYCDFGIDTDAGCPYHLKVCFVFTKPELMYLWIINRDDGCYTILLRDVNNKDLYWDKVSFVTTLTKEIFNKLLHDND